MKNYQIINVSKRQHVLTAASTREGTIFPEANYLGTGLALCGVLKKDQTLEKWIKKHGK